MEEASIAAGAAAKVAEGTKRIPGYQFGDLLLKRSTFEEYKRGTLLLPDFMGALDLP